MLGISFLFANFSKKNAKWNATLANRYQHILDFHPSSFIIDSHISFSTCRPDANPYANNISMGEGRRILREIKTFYEMKTRRCAGVMKNMEWFLHMVLR